MTSLFELFKIGVGPSSSHTVGPMRAALSFVHGLQKLDALQNVERLQIDLYGSLALTGIGHATDRACILGLSGCAPDSLTAEETESALTSATNRSLNLGGVQRVPFHHESDLLLHRDQMYPDPGQVTHPNGMRFTAFDNAGATVAAETYFSIGGGFIVTEEHFAQSAPAIPQSSRTVPSRFAVRQRC